jgi:hypothetical protein
MSSQNDSVDTHGQPEEHTQETGQHSPGETEKSQLDNQPNNSHEEKTNEVLSPNDEQDAQIAVDSKQDDSDAVILQPKEQVVSNVTEKESAEEQVLEESNETVDNADEKTTSPKKEEPKQLEESENQNQADTQIGSNVVQVVEDLPNDRDTDKKQDQADEDDNQNLPKDEQPPIANNIDINQPEVKSVEEPTKAVIENQEESNDPPKTEETIDNVEEKSSPVENEPISVEQNPTNNLVNEEAVVAETSQPIETEKSQPVENDKPSSPPSEPMEPKSNEIDSQSILVVLIPQEDQPTVNTTSNDLLLPESNKEVEAKPDGNKTTTVSLETFDKPAHPSLKLKDSSDNVSQSEVKKVQEPTQQQAQSESVPTKSSLTETMQLTPNKANSVTTPVPSKPKKATAPIQKAHTTKPSTTPTDGKTITLSQDELKKWGEQAKRQNQIIKEKDDEIEKLKKKVEYEKEGLLDRNKHLQGILDSFKGRYEKAKTNSVTLEFRNTELNKEIRKIEEEMSFYKEEVRAKFNLEIKIAELNEEIAALRAFKKEALNNDLNVRLKELQAQNSNLQKQNELINLNNANLEKNTKKYLNLCEQRQQEISALKTETSRATKKCEDLVAQVGSLKKDNSELESKLNAKTTALDQLKALHSRECKTFKGQIQESEKAMHNLQDENTNLKAELNKIIESLRRTPVSGVESSSSQQPQQNREEKIILESLVTKNKELEATIRELERENKRLKLQSETFAEKLKAKEHDFLELATYAYEGQSSETLKARAKELSETENKRVYNAKFNKSIDDMRDLIGRVIIENILLKRKTAN